MTDSVTPIRFNVQEVGKHVKSSKKRFTWEVSLNNKQHSIVLDFSFISGKVKVAVDRKILLENQLPANTSFQYPFTLDGNSLNVIQQGQTFELRINNKVFSHLYNQAKTNKEFKKYEDQIKDFKVNQNQFQAKKLTLSIGGVGGGVKKKSAVQSSQGHSWNAFGGDQMSGFPNYFDGQSTSTTSSEKVQQPPQAVFKKTGSLLDEQSSINVMQKPTQKIQNILDFQAQIQNTPVQPQQPITKAQQDFNTMQYMFQTMNLNTVGQQQNKQSVVIDNSEVDFFSNTQQQSSKPSIVQQPQIDFFSGMNTKPVPPPVTQNNEASNDYNTMRYMFATNQNTSSNGINQQISFNTSSPPKSQAQSIQGWNTQAINQPVNINLGINLNTKPVEPLIPDEKSFSTLQGLFATNSMTGSQATNLNISQPQQPVITQPQTNFNLNTQHFATQGVSMQQGFGTSSNINAQTFGTQNFMGQGFGSSQINFLGQQKPVTQQPITQTQQYNQQPVSQQVSQPVSQINPSEFGTMQLLFQTNTAPIQQNIQIQSTVQPPVVANVQKTNDSFTQQFATMGTSSVQSPNNMFMNTYGGSGNSNLSFDMSLGQNAQQFNTSVNGSMMKKKPSANPVIGDLL